METPIPSRLTSNALLRRLTFLQICFYLWLVCLRSCIRAFVCSSLRSFAAISDFVLTFAALRLCVRLLCLFGGGID